ncbi:SDR family NAD(P)-dependent oxidoreductase [Nonomuraea sp. NPDC050790]|uniref:SDR family NAD(P)-dependent oxidoreductase n=1 Tax=Nonomuraea sp. NPDC050790 TaxID=3364371 RepID=UPI0037ABFC85
MKTFLITGVSSGLGRAFAAGALEAGHTVVGTVRKEGDARAFEGLAPGRALARVLDVTDTDAVFRTVDEAEATASPIDVRAAHALLTVIDAPDPPAHLVLGSDALRLVADGRAAVDREIERWADLSRSTDFPDGGAQIRP